MPEFSPIGICDCDFCAKKKKSVGVMILDGIEGGGTVRLCEDCARQIVERFEGQVCPKCDRELPCDCE